MRRKIAIFLLLVLVINLNTNMLFAEPSVPPPTNVPPVPTATGLPDPLEINGMDQDLIVFNIKYENLVRIRQALEALLLNSEIRYTFFQGTAPQLILVGPNGKVRPIADLVKALDEQPVARNLVSISAVLQEVSSEKNLEVGINFKNITVAGQAGYDSNFGKSLNHSVTAASGLDVSYQDVRSKGKVIAASEIITPSGVKSELKSSDQIPVMNRDASGYISTDYKDVDTNIAVTPVIIKYDTENPMESLVRMDITIKVGLIARERTLGIVSAPQISVREVTTSRILKADKKEYVVAVIVRDEDFRTRSGIPILSQIPIINLFTSTQKDKRVRTTAFLKIAVNLLPAETP